MSLNPSAKPFSFSTAAPAFVPSTSSSSSNNNDSNSNVPPTSWEDDDTNVESTTNTEATAAAEEEEDKQQGRKNTSSVPEPILQPRVVEKLDTPDGAEQYEPDAAELEAELAAIKAEEEKAQRAAAARARTKAKASSKNDDVEVNFHDDREHVNIVFIGHVDAGKSTISGQLMLLTGQVDERTIAKYEKEAKEKNRESWYLAFIMDTNEEERSKGKTVEVGRAHFATEKKRYTLLDAPGHKKYVPNMIGGTAQADVGILVISARKGEFEAGFNKGGQTREHAMLAKTLGVQRLVVCVNKMDEKTVKWSEKRYNEIEGKLSPFLATYGYKGPNVSYIPISGFTGANLKELVPKDVCKWYNGKTLFDTLDDLPPVKRDLNASVRVPIVDRYKDMGSVVILGKLESGTLSRNTKLIMAPVNKELDVVSLEVEGEEVEHVRPGENLVIKVKGCDEDDVQGGFVLGSIDKAPMVTEAFECQLNILDLLDHCPILTAGYQCVLHIHSLKVECCVTKLKAKLERPSKKSKSNKPVQKKAPKFVKSGDKVIARIRTPQTISIEKFEDFAQMGRFTLRDEGQTIAIGKVTKLLKRRTAE